MDQPSICRARGLPWVHEIPRVLAEGCQAPETHRGRIYTFLELSTWDDPR